MWSSVSNNAVHPTLHYPPLIWTLSWSRISVIVLPVVVEVDLHKPALVIQENIREQRVGVINTRFQDCLI
jgi:hypothetical protein